MISSNVRNAMQTSTPKTYSRLTRGLAGLVIVTFLTSCATDPFHQTALKQAKEGPVDEGVAKLKESSAKQPESQAYRVDYLRERERVVNKLLIDAARVLGKGDLNEADAIYQEVLGMDPDNAQAKLGLMEVDRGRRHAEAITNARDALGKADYEAARVALQPVLIESPQDAEAQDLSRQIDAARFAGISNNQIPELGAAYKKPVSLQFRDANLKMIFEAISKTSGLNILMDKDIKSDLKATIFVKQASVEDTLSLLLMQNQLEKKVLNESTIYIYPSTPAKLKEHQDLVVRTFQLTNADVKQMQTLLKTVLKTKDMYINEKANSIVMRDTPEAVALAAKLLAAQDVNEPEVMLELEVLEVSHSLAEQLGIQYPNQVGFVVNSSVVKTLQDYKNINASKINVNGILGTASALGVNIDLKKIDGDVNTLANPRIRVRQREKAKIHIGQRYPIVTNVVTPSTSTPVTTQQVQYIDLGLKLEVEPEIHLDGEVGIKTSLEVSSLGAPIEGQSVAPPVNTRVVNTVLRLKDGETQILGGLIENDENKSVTKVPGLGDIPLLGRMFSTQKKDKSKTELILAITPHIIRNIHQPDADLATYWSGTDSAVKSRPITVEKMEGLKLESSTATPTPGAPVATPRPTVQPAPANPGVETPVDTKSATPPAAGASSSQPAAPASEGASPQATPAVTAPTSRAYVVPRVVPGVTGVTVVPPGVGGGMSDAAVSKTPSQ